MSLLSETSLHKIAIKKLGRISYTDALQFQEEAIHLRAEDKIEDTIFILEHNPVYTGGKDSAENLRNLSLPAPYHATGRGGKITFHGPGQLVAYFIFKINLNELSSFVSFLEDLCILSLQEHNIPAYSRKNESDSYGKRIRGSWVNMAGKKWKIASQGIETKTINGKVITMHGLAINVSTDLSYFNYISPCGFNSKIMTSISEYKGEPIDLANFELTFINLLSEEGLKWRS